MKRRAFVAVALVVASAHLAIAQEGGGIVSYYDSELFHFNYNMFGGIVLEYGDLSSSIQFGIPSFLRDTLSSYPDSGEYVKSFSDLNRTGNIMLWGGLAVALAGSYYPIFAHAGGIDDTELAISLGTTLGGCAVTIIGSFFYEAAIEKLFQSVRVYNKHRIEEFK
jgi:hypothetical protein